MMALSHRVSAYVIECVVKRIVFFSPNFIVNTIAYLEDGSKPVEHSSRSCVDGLPKRAMDIHIFRLFPPDN